MIYCNGLLTRVNNKCMYPFRTLFDLIEFFPSIRYKSVIFGFIRFKYFDTNVHFKSFFIIIIIYTTVLRSFRLNLFRCSSRPTNL